MIRHPANAPRLSRIGRHLLTGGLGLSLAWAAMAEGGPGFSMKLTGLDRWLELTGVDFHVRGAPSPATALPLMLKLEKSTDAGSPLLMQHCGSGMPIQRVSLAHTDTSGLVLRITLEEAHVRTFTLQTGTNAMTAPSDRFTLESSRVEWSWFGPGNAHVLEGGEGARFEASTRQLSPKRYPPFRARLDPGSTRQSLELICPVDAGRSYVVKGTRDPSLSWQVLDRFTAEQDGTLKRRIEDSPAMLFLLVEAVD